MEIVTKDSPSSVTETVARLIDIVSGQGMKVFAVIDQAAEARSVGLELRETTLVLFGSPAAGTLVMEASPLVAIHLPLKVLIWAGGRQTKVSYESPAVIAADHGLSPEMAARISGIDAVTDDLVAG